MAREIREFAVVIPHGTPKTAPLVTSIAFPERIVTAVSYRVPPGPSGVMGWALTSAGTPVIPIQPSTYIVTDNQSDTWFLEDYLDSGNWQVTGYNTGLYDHTVYLTFQLDLPGATIAPPPSLSGQGVGVVGTIGTVIPPPQPAPPPLPLTPSPGDAEAVITAVLAAMVEQMNATAAG